MAETTLTKSQLKRRRQAANREARAKAEKRAALDAARAICPTPRKASYRTPEGAASGAQAIADKRGGDWDVYSCRCGRFHMRPAKAAR